MKIDAEKSIPKYLRLKDIIKQHFSDKQYQNGQKIPTENELIAQFAVSRSTVRQTLAELVNEGIVYKKQGSGTFFKGIASNGEAQSSLIGVLTPRITYYIYPQLIQGIDEVVHDKGYNIVLSNAKADPAYELVCLEQLLEKRIDGLLLEPTGGFYDTRNSALFKALQKRPIPIVLMDWVIEELGVSSVSIDDSKGGFLATDYLARAGHTRIAYVYPNDKIPAMQRYTGYRQALDEYGIAYDSRLDKPTITAEWDNPAHLAVLMKELLDLGTERPTAIFFFNDDAALHAYDMLEEAGLRIPDDISIVGFDNSEIGARAEVSLTSVMHSKYQIGKWAAEILFDEIRDRTLPVRQLTVKPTIVERNSVKILSR